MSIPSRNRHPCSLLKLAAAALLAQAITGCAQNPAGPVRTYATLQHEGSNGSWLDRTPVNWNGRMSGLPRPVSFLDPENARTRCRDFVCQPDSPAERAIVGASWILYGPVQFYELTKVITAMSGADGMCRPLGYQAFVYWEGRYAGTLSPAAMNSRTDGALTRIDLASPTRITAKFARYTATDPLCCPTRTSQVTYEVKPDDMPLVTPVSITTVPQ